ncbi:MAG TPA: hypothetical protein VFA34_13200 [Actinomycetota bacterium]|nr:hypothetical protein [Actinomycetota bacterium]
MRPDDLAEGYGRSAGTPVLEAELVNATVGAPEGRELWHLAADVELPRGPVRVEQRLTLEADGSYVLVADDSSLRVDPGGTLTLQAPRESMSRQLVTTYGVPLLLHGRKTLVLHACGAIPPDGDGAVIVCGPSGAGKSTLLVALIAAGWRAISEDLCVVDSREPSPVVWPGPPWIRRDGDGPEGSYARFRTAEKTAWDIAPWQVDRAAPIQQLVFMEHAAGDTIKTEDVDRADSVSHLARLTAWLGESSLRAAATFAPCVQLAGSAMATRVRFPVSDDWTTGAEKTLRRLAER